MIDKEKEIGKLINDVPSKTRDTLIPLLQEIQDINGYINKESLVDLSNKFNLPTSKLYGLATFYNQFRLRPRGKYHIQVCNGSSCHLTNSGKIIRELEKELHIKAGQTTRDKKFSFEILPCIGACGQSPVIAINDEYYIKVSIERLKEIINLYKEK